MLRLMMVKFLHLLGWSVPRQVSPKEEAVLMVEAAELLRKQQDALVEAAKQIAQWQDLALTAQRSARDLAIAFRVACDAPEIDLREELDDLVQQLCDSVATIEEHTIY